ncbi:bifunctional 3'-5' exonuclease/DNA polymerase [Sanguibacter antarcticus]|uniref:DNA-directed DNA polymerase n=1 Tax=Sanguibacter antarcticus TaxID=372484 RepID=A0A2A9E7K0_9MICO|nr:bifunctional 3'-5' exonuclease/DNA polymerase [Sanguibacter antarcticus]PFG34199.1 DNA polymerase-1 [Sanguibacter antarcticus]
MHVVVVPAGEASLTLHDIDVAPLGDTGVDAGAVQVRTSAVVPAADLAALVHERESAAEPPRWVWSDTAALYPPLLAEGVSVARCWDLRLCHTILRTSALTADSTLATAPPSGWDEARVASPVQDGLFDLAPSVPLDPVAEMRRQREALAGATALDGSSASARLGLLLAAESAGALVAAEMTFAGVPWDAAEHDRILADALGPRPSAGFRPSLLEAKLAEVREALGVDDLNPDSPAELLRQLRSAGLAVASTRSWELRGVEHPAIKPLLEYKKLSRLLTANGWHWLDTWVADGRFRPVYVPGGVVTGRWASDGGGALQLPHQVRGAVRADPGWTLVVADAAQLEPRILAAMSGDEAMARAGQAADMYEGMVATGAVETRQQAKYGMLGAMYGGTQGESGRMLPRITKAYPQALALVEHAARAGERGQVVSTWLGRSSPLPGGAWRAAQEAAADQEATAADQDRARGLARGWGRFTRNFVVQGTAAEWALCWMALLRLRLRALDGPAVPGAAPRPAGGPHLAFFLHDEVMVHSPAGQADEVARIVEETAAEAGRLLFTDARVEFRVTVATVRSYADAKGVATDLPLPALENDLEGDAEV